MSSRIDTKHKTPYQYIKVPLSEMKHDLSSLPHMLAKHLMRMSFDGMEAFYMFSEERYNPNRDNK
jgi:hypothetical protein